jgi:hypothetical protein
MKSWGKWYVYTKYILVSGKADKKGDTIILRIISKRNIKTYKVQSKNQKTK